MSSANINFVKYAALCPFGVEKLVKDEIKKLGYTVQGSSPGRVDFEGPWEAVYQTNLWLRTAERVLVKVAECPCSTFDELFDTLKEETWEDWFTPKSSIRIEKVRVYKSLLTSVPAIQATVQKAVFERLCKIWNVQRLEQNGPETAIRVFLSQNRAEVFIDTTGESLHQRGYRIKTGTAPLKENMAASLLLFSGWRRRNPLIDPFCGSATILTEALLYAFDVPPGGKRRFTFELLAPFIQSDWMDLRFAAREKADFSHRVRMGGSDKDSQVLLVAKANLESLGFEHNVELKALDVKDAKASLWGFDEPGFIITNPPYGERLESPEEARMILSNLKNWSTQFPHWNWGVLSPFEDFSDLVGQEPYVVRKLSNGPLKVNYFQCEEH